MHNHPLKPGATVDLDSWDPDTTNGFHGTKEDAEAFLLNLIKKLEGLQELLYAEQKHKILIVLQAMDTGGKDGTVRKVFEGINPQGVKVVSFKQPSTEEAAHDYLWRIHKEAPKNGEIVIFNRSHYEDVLVPQVHNLFPSEIIERRYGHINDFERMLVDEGTTILKFFLHISKDEQKKRLRERLHEPDKHWKFSESDIEERGYWHKYQKAYEKTLSQTNTRHAPWYIVPANHKWYRNYFVADVVVRTLEELKMSYPAAIKGLSKIVVK